MLKKRIMSDLVTVMRTFKIVTKLLILASILVISLGCADAQLTQLDPPTTDVTKQSMTSTVQISDLIIESAEVNPREALTITANVTNTSAIEESYKAELRINDTLEAERIVSIPAGGTEALYFSVCKCDPGAYKVTLGDITGHFLVLSPVKTTKSGSLETSKPEMTAAPDFTGMDILTEKTITLNEFRGSTVLLNFVNYGCSSRLNNTTSAQLLVIRDLEKNRGDFIPISISCGCCSPVELQEFAADNGLTWPWIIDVDDAIIHKYTDYLTEYGFPTLVFVNKKQYITEVTGYCDFFKLNVKIDETF